MAGWNGDLERWLAPFLARLSHQARRRMCPLYVAGLIGPGDRKSVEPMALRLAPGDYDQLHHFISSGVWDEAPLEEELAVQANKLISGADTVLVVDDTALPKKGAHSVGVAPPIRLGAGQDRQLPDAGVPDAGAGRGSGDDRPAAVPAGELDRRPDRMAKARLPETWRAARTKPEIALAEIDRIRAAGVRFATVLADAGYGLSASFRQGLDARGLKWAVGIPKLQKAYLQQRQTLSFRSRDAGGHASATSRINSPRLPKTCSPPQSGDASAGVKEPKDLWRRPSPPYACGSLMARHNASTRRACSTCRAGRPGSSASVALRASANTIFPTCLPTPTSRRSPPRSGRDGSASKPTSSSRKNSASTTSKADPGMACTATRS